jgi:hypothetical protein
MKSRLLLLVFLFMGVAPVVLSPPLFAYQRPPTPEDLIRRSEVIAQGTIGPSHQLPDKDPYQVFQTEVTFDKVFKGSLIRQQPVPIITVRLKPGEEREDPPRPLPAKGSRGVFFLKRDAGNRWRLINSRHGFLLIPETKPVLPEPLNRDEIERALNALPIPEPKN